MEPAGLSVTAVAERLKLDRKTLSRLVNARAPVTVPMAMRLAKAFRTTPDMWLGMQVDYDLWQAEKSNKIKLPPIRPFAHAAPHV